MTVADGTETAQASFVLTVDPAPTYYLAEGATGAFFDTDILIANPHARHRAGHDHLPQGRRHDDRADAGPRAARRARRSGSSSIAGLEAANVLRPLVATGVPLVVERTMRWDASRLRRARREGDRGRGADWYFAEGSQGFFSTYLLLVNPQTAANVAHVTYLREGGAALLRDYPLAAGVAHDDRSSAREPELRNRSFGARVTFDQPGDGGARDVLRQRSRSGAAAMNRPASRRRRRRWFLAEGATGPFFDDVRAGRESGRRPARCHDDVSAADRRRRSRTTHDARGAPAADDATSRSKHPSLASAAVATRVDPTRRSSSSARSTGRSRHSGTRRTTASA